MPADRGSDKTCSPRNHNPHGLGIPLVVIKCWLKIGEAWVGAVLVRHRYVCGRNSPIDCETWIIPSDTTLAGRRPVFGHLVNHFGMRLQCQVAVREAGGHPHL